MGATSARGGEMRKRNKEWYFEKDHKICTNFIFCLDVASTKDTWWLTPCYHSKPHICDFPSLCSRGENYELDFNPKCVKLKKEQKNE